MYSWEFENKMKEAYIKGDLKELESLKKECKDSSKLFLTDNIFVENKVKDELNKIQGTDKDQPIYWANLYNTLYGLYTKESTFLTSLDTYIGMLRQRIATQNQQKGKKQ